MLCTLCVCVCLVTQSCLTLCNPIDCNLPGFSVHGDSLGKNTRMGCHALLQGLFPTQGSNPGLPHCRRILYQQSHKRSPSIKTFIDKYSHFLSSIFQFSSVAQPHGLHAAHQASLSLLSPKVCPSSCPLNWYHLILCHPLLLLPSIFPSIRVFSNE